jgi:ADP-ribose pyrophosphatase YjhB (NUDIX family)
MIPAPGAGSESTKKKRKRKRSGNRGPQSSNPPQNGTPKAAVHNTPKRAYAKRVDEVSAGGLVIDTTGALGLLIGRYDQKDSSRTRVLWSLPKGHIEEGETPEQAAIREVAEETGITSEITKSLGVIDFWFMAGEKRIHKTVHHFIFKESGGLLAAQESEVDLVSWFPLSEIIGLLAYPDEKKLIARSGELEK